MKFNAEMKTKSTCPMKDTLLNLVDNLEKGESVKAKFVIGGKEEGKYTLYIDLVSDDCLAAFIDRVLDGDGNPVPDETVGELAENGAYKVSVTGRSGNKIYGNIETEEKKAEAGGFAISSVALAKMMELKIRDGIITREEMDARVKLMKSEGYDEELILRIVEKYRKYRKAPAVPGCIWVDPYRDESRALGVEPIQCEVSRCIADRYGIMLQGPKSTGKNVFCDTIAWKHGMPVRLVTFHRQMTMGDLFGGKTTDNSASDTLRSDKVVGMAQSYVLVKCRPEKALPADFRAASEFELLKARAASTSIVNEVAEVVEFLIDGGIIVLNEFNLADPNLAAALLNPLLDGTGFMTIPGRGEVPINPDCVVICTQNEGYAGTDEQNEATMSRLAFFDFKQPKDIGSLLKASVAAELARNGFSVPVPDDMVRQANKLYANLLSAWKDETITSSALNIRGFTRAVAAAAESGGRSKLWRQLQIHVVNGCPLTERGVIGALVKTHVAL